MPHSNDLSRSDIQGFYDNGFAGPFVCSLPDIFFRDLRDKILELEQKRSINPLYERFVLRDLHLYMPELLKLFSHPDVVSRVQKFLDPSLILWRSFVFLKKPNVGELGWHQEWGHFDGEEIGGKIPALSPPDRFLTGSNKGEPWDLSIWFALTDATPEMGPVRFIKGSHRRKYPTELVPLTESGFGDQISDFFNIPDVKELIARANANTLLLETVDTSHFFEDTDPGTFTVESARNLIQEKMSKIQAVVTPPFDVPPDQIHEMPMRAGEFVVFYERTMHGSAANRSNKNRLGVNCRMTTGDMLIYPQRSTGDFIDGSDLDIRKHFCVHLCGPTRHPKNVYAPET